MTGQEIIALPFSDVAMITVFGMSVSMAAMIILWIFVVILSKVAKVYEAPAMAAAKATAPQTSANATSADANGVTEEEAAAVVAVICAEAGIDPSKHKVTARRR